MSLKISNLKKSFGSQKIFDGLSLEFSERGLYFVKGESGVGKTTLLRIIAGLDSEFEGEVTGGGIGNVSVAFQEHRLFPTLNALDNVYKVAFPTASEENLSKAKEILRALKFSDEDMKKRPAELSGGMKQRVSLARAFLAKGAILILDEPTKELDPELADTVIEMIKKEGERRLVIAVSHRQEDEIALDATVIDLK